MQSSPASGRSSRSSGVPNSSRTMHSHHLPSDHPTLSPSRVVVAEGSEFVLQALPTRASPSAYRASSIDHRVSAPHLSASPSHLPSSSQLRAVSATSTPPRSARQSERPYRPPPSSSARFYERQQQRWMLQQPSLLPYIPATPASASTSLYSQTTPPRASSLYQPPPPSSPPYALPAPLPHSSVTAEEQEAFASRSRSGSNASAVSHFRATSVSSLAPPETKNRARSGSDAGSFTRSCISNGYNSNTDDEYTDHEPVQSGSATSYARSGWQTQAGAATPVSALKDQDISFLATTATQQQQVNVDDTLGDSGDADWDAELGISEADHAEPLRLPSLQHADLALHPSPIIPGDAATASSNVISSKVAIDRPGSQLQPQIESIKAADLKGIRVTSAVSESWDGDFLFQNDDEDPIDSETQYGGSSQLRGSGEQHRTTGSSASRLSHSQADADAESDDDDDDVENWDDAFAWNADSIMTPSASMSSSLHDIMMRSNIQNNDLNSTPTRAKRTSSRELPLDASRRLDFERGKDKASARNRLSNGSSASNITDFSARLAAQSDADSYRPRPSQDSDDLSASRFSPSKQHNALGLVPNVRKNRRNTDSRSDDSGDETETESPAKEIAVPLAARPARRSLGAALGFDSRRKTAAAMDASTAVQSPMRGGNKTKEDASLSTTKSHARTQSKSKLGALQRLSFSRSRLSVANVSSTSVNQMPDTGESPQRPYADNANQSQASLLSHASTSSSRSRRGASPSSLEKSYTALRSTSFRRFLGRSDKNGAAANHSVNTAGETPPPFSPPRRGSEQSPPMLPISSPQRHTPPASSQPKSPPFAWTGFRRSIEVTPKRAKDQKSRRDSDSFQRDSPGQPLSAQAGSPTMPPTALAASMQQSSASLALLQGRSDTSGPNLEGSSLDLRESGLLPAAGLRRDFASSNTLRAGASIGMGETSTPTRSGRSKADADSSTKRWRAAGEVGNRAPVRADGTSADVPPTSYVYGGINMSRGPDGHSSASRSVSTSTAHSHTSAESIYGYRMRQQISVSSGPEAQDSETSYGTSVGSSPGLTGQWSWAPTGKRGATPSIDTKDTAWMASVDLPERQEQSIRHDSHHDRATSMPGSPLAHENTLDGESMLPRSQTARKQSAPDTSLSPPHHASLLRGAPAQMETPLVPSHPAPPGVRPTSSNTDASVAGMPSASQASSSTSSSRKGAPRRNSLSDLKIPSRISKAQTGIRNNISLVRDFARGIEELKVLKASYMDHKIKTPLTPSEVEDRVQNWLECADVLIGLGEGRSESDATARVDTLSHTPLSTHIDTRRTTFSDASSHASPASPLDGWTSRQSSVSGARSTSGTSQATTSTTDGVRSVDVHREIDILSAILGGHKLSSASQTDTRPHTRFQSDPYTRDELPHRDAAYSARSPAVEGSSLATPDREDLDVTQNEEPGRKKSSERPFNTAPVLTHANASSGEVAVFDGVDVGDANRSAKRRLRSASRAGLQGLRDLLRVFKGPAADDAAAAAASKTGATAEAVLASDEVKEQQPRYSMDGRPSTPSASKQKRKSINLKRRSFLRSRTSLESVSAKAAEGQATYEAAPPPLPVSPEGGRYTPASSASSSSKVDRRSRPELSPGKTSLDITWESGSRDGHREAPRSASATSKAVRRISLQSALSGTSTKRRSVDGLPPGLVSAKQTQSTSQQQSLQQQQQHRRPSLAVRPNASTASMTPPDPRRASTSVDTVHRHHQLQLQQGLTPARTAAGRSYSSTNEAPPPQPPVVQKLALRPEAMPGLLVYVQATKQHLQAAIDELGVQQGFAVR